jgi:hypothetical protein
MLLALLSLVFLTASHSLARDGGALISGIRGAYATLEENLTLPAYSQWRS